VAIPYQHKIIHIEINTKMIEFNTIPTTFFLTKISRNNKKPEKKIIEQANIWIVNPKGEIVLAAVRKLRNLKPG
jgi:hypothetical protein